MEGGGLLDFFNYLANHPRFLEVVQQVWCRQEIKFIRDLWSVLKVLKVEVKKMQKSEFGNVHGKIAECRSNLTKVQDELSLDPVDGLLKTEENNLIGQLKFWMKTECSIVQQKSRITWLRQGDVNSSYFHVVMRDRNNHSRIERLVDDAGRVCSVRKDLEQEVLLFYKSLLGSSKEGLKSVDVTIVRKGKVLNMQQRRMLSSDISA